MNGLPARLAQYASLFAYSGQEAGVDPYLLAAICDHESLGGLTLTPKGPGGTGDKGNGLGLMQIDKNAWPEWCSMNDWTDPALNIQKGAEILAGYIRRFHGCEPSGIAAYNCGPGPVIHVNLHHHEASPADFIKFLDQRTTGKNYVSDVLGRRARFKNAATTMELT